MWTPTPRSSLGSASLQIEHGADGSFRISQLMLVDRIIESIPSMINASSSKTPALPGTTLTNDTDDEPRKETWNYRSIIGTLNFLVTRSHPELSFSAHQCARFSNNSIYSHKQAMGDCQFCHLRKGFDRMVT